MIRHSTVACEWALLKNDFLKEMNKVCRKDLLQVDISEKEEAIYFYQNEIINTLKQYLGVKHFFLTANGTQSIYIALKIKGIGYDDEVITTPYSFIATANAIELSGAKPIFVDIKKDTWNIDEDKIEEKITNKTKAILTVDLFGNPCNYDKINEIGKKYNIPIIDDACQAFMSEYHGKKIGNICDITCFSFENGKIFGNLGRGGAIATNNNIEANIVESILDHGSNGHNHYIRVGTNGDWEYMEIIYLYCKLKYLKNNLQYRNDIINIYKQMKNVEFQTIEKYGTSAWYKPQVIFKNEHSLNIAKNIFELDNLYSKDVPSNTRYNNFRNNTPISKYISENSLTLPMYEFLDKNLVQKSVEEYNSLIGKE